MVVLKIIEDDNKQNENICKALIHNGDDDLRRKALFGSYPDLDAILWLKRLALDPCKPCKQEPSREENLRLLDRILNVRKVMLMTNDDSPRRKRKLQLFLKDNEIGATTLATEKFNPQIYTKPDSYIFYSGGGEILNRKDCRNSRSSPVNHHQLTPENTTVRKPPLFDDYKRLPIPIGPRFQADVPEWSEQINGVASDSLNLRFLGSCVWPVRNKNPKKFPGKIGKGRDGSCSCISPNSYECIKKHVVEKRIKLKLEIGSIFFTWKFDEMGIVVSNSWTLEEQQSFSLLRQKSLKDGTNFWEQAFMCFNSKSKKSILSYYFNVFAPRRLSILTKLSLKKIDSDGEDDPMHNREGFKGRIDGSCKSKDVKTRYLRH